MAVTAVRNDVYKLSALNDSLDFATLFPSGGSPPHAKIKLVHIYGATSAGLATIKQKADGSGNEVAEAWAAIGGSVPLYLDLLVDDGIKVTALPAGALVMVYLGQEA